MNFVGGSPITTASDIVGAVVSATLVSAFVVRHEKEAAHQGLTRAPPVGAAEMAPSLSHGGVLCDRHLGLCAGAHERGRAIRFIRVA